MKNCSGKVWAQCDFMNFFPSENALSPLCEHTKIVFLFLDCITFNNFSWTQFLDAKIKFIIFRKIYYILEYLSFIFHSCAQDEQEGSGCEKSGNVPKLSLQGESVPATSIRHRQQKKIVGEPHLKTSYLQNIRISSNQAWDLKKHSVFNYSLVQQQGTIQHLKIY